MNYQDTMLTCSLVMESNAVPLVTGESGIGKTALSKELADRMNAYIINIDANLLKEGEIGGLPTVEDYEIQIDGKKLKKKRTVYALHCKLIEIDEILRENPNKKILLFIDEINRCEHAVQQELMNLILNREINGYILSKNVKVLAAMNPSNKYDNFNNTDYQVIDMDPAQENRFVWLKMDSDSREWIRWGAKKEEKLFCEKFVSNIHKDILEFIATFPEYLHTPNSTEFIKATPRSWERVSDSYRAYLKNKDKYSKNIFYNVVKGNVGSSIAQDFYNFLLDNKNPIINPQEVFKNKKLSKEIIKKVNIENHSRLYLTAKHCLNYLVQENIDKEIKVQIFSDFLQFYPSDLKMAIMQEIKFNYENTLYKLFMNVPSFVEGYFKVFSDIN